jgi:hypothetical protein
MLVGCAARPPASPFANGAVSQAWTYEAVANDAGHELLVQATFPGGTLPELSVLHGAEAYVRDVEVAVGTGWRSVALRGASWRVPECRNASCTVRYRFLLRDAARGFDDIEHARAFGDVAIARPSMWMMHPWVARRGTRVRLHVATPPGTTFVTGIYPAEDGQPDTYELDAAVLPAAPYTVFGTIDVRRSTFRGAAIDIAHQPDKIPMSKGAVERWVAESAQAVGDYFGCFPVPRVLLILVPTEGDDVMRGHALGDGGAVIVVEVGKRTADYQLKNDWVLPHELVHMGFPSVDPKHHWLEEGVATYVQPIARARAGIVEPERAWLELARGLPRGAAHRGDRGLDDTSAWGRTYWGGALFFLMADLEIRQRTHGRFSLEDALRGIVAAGGNIAVEWDFARVLDAGDRAVGVPVLRELYERMGHKGAPTDVDLLLKRLGIAQEEGGLALDERAPLADLRRAITSKTQVSQRIATCPAPPSFAQRFVHNTR